MTYTSVLLSVHLYIVLSEMYVRPTVRQSFVRSTPICQYQSSRILFADLIGTRTNGPSDTDCDVIMTELTRANPLLYNYMTTFINERLLY